MSKLFDRLKNAARLRGENAGTPKAGGLLSQALQRAQTKRDQARDADDPVAAQLDTAAAESVAAGNEAAWRERDERVLERTARAREELERRAEAAALARAEAEQRLVEAARARARAEDEAAAAALARADAEERAAATERAHAEAEEDALAQSRLRAEAEARHHEQERARLEASERALHAAAERARLERETRQLEISSREASESASHAERALRAAPLRKRISRGATGALVALGAFLVAALAWQLAPWRAAPPHPAVPVFQLDHRLKM